LADTTTNLRPVAESGHDFYDNPGGDAKDTYTGIVGVKDAFTYADQITKTENIRLEGSFADAVRGLHVYGGKAIRPQWLVAHDITDTVDTSESPS
jgi:hypothetical protein